MYYFGDNAKNGKCNCKSKCGCIKTTSIISSNGSILFYGFRSLKQRDEVLF